LPLARLLLNDAFEARAQLFSEGKITTDLPKEPTTGIPKITRVQCLEDLPRLVTSTNTLLTRLVNYQEARRYWSFYANLVSFEESYAAFKRSSAGKGSKDPDTAK